jgi:hypothetical protein
MIRHTVVFKLKDQLSSIKEKDFFIAIKKLSSISGVQNFECLKQIGKKNNFDFGLSMEFNSIEEYENYNNHPMHVHFVKEYWMKDVEDFLEIDYQPL